MADYKTIESGDTSLRGFSAVARADGSPITTGTVNWYLLALSGTNSGKWWKTADATWAVAETANAMSHQADGHWTRDPVASATSPFDDGVIFLEYAKESTNLHIPVARYLKAGYTPSADSSKRVDVGKILGTASQGAAGYVGIDWAHVNAPTTTVNLSGTTVGTVTTTTTATNLTNLPAAPTDWLSALAVSSAAVTKIQAGLSTYGGGDTTGTTALLGRIGSAITISSGAVAATLTPTGLDAIPTTAPAGVASNFREMVVQTWRRFFLKATRSTTQIKTFADDGTTVITTQTISDDGAGNESQGAAA